MVRRYKIQRRWRGKVRPGMTSVSMLKNGGGHTQRITHHALRPHPLRYSSRHRNFCAVFMGCNRMVRGIAVLALMQVRQPSIMI